MKSIYVLLFLFTSFLVNAQDDLNRTWFLTALILDGDSVEIPGGLFSNLSIDTSSGEYIGSLACNGYGGLISDFTETSFMIQEYYQTLDVCDDSAETLFENNFFYIFGDPQPQEASYAITEQGDLSLQLTITMNDGDIAIYSSTNSNIPSELTSTSWFLNSYEVNGELIGYPNDYPGPITLQMLEDGTQEIETACTGGASAFSAYTYFGIPTYQSSGIAVLAIDCGIPAFDNFDNTHFGLLESHTYSYEIIEEDDIFRFILTNIENGDRIFYTDTVLNTEEFNQNITVELFPNPTADKLTITGEHIENIQSYQIIDISGSIVLQNNFDTIIDVESLATGMYFLKLQGIQLETTHRFIKK